MEYSTTFGVDCYGWGIPHGVGHSPPAWMSLTSEFTGLTWMLLLMTLCVSAAVLQALSHHQFPSALCFTCNTLIAVPSAVHTQSNAVRMFLTVWLLYCIVISVAYQVHALLICHIIICYSNQIINWKQTHNLCHGKFKLSDLKRKIWTSDLQISSLALYHLWYPSQLTVQV